MRFIAKVKLKNNKVKTINNFAGTIKTFNDLEFVVSGVKLNDDKVHLFTNFSGRIENLHFVVEYDYQNSSSLTYGLFDTNNGNLLNIGAEVSGTYKHKVSSSVNFGLLVAINNSSIVNTNATTCVYGSINLESNGSAIGINFGLVGTNNANAVIDGQYEGTTSSSGGTGRDVVFVSNAGEDGTIANLNVISELSSANIGLIAGYNKGNIKECYVKGSIKHSGEGNVGGVIGYNEFTSKTHSFTFGNNGEIIIAPTGYSISVKTTDTLSFSLSN